ncbi:hypothetical protein M758_2G195300 [Ceratodon purpureus]|nr:hypothetical protein M758_2G195300 [Ceratodon purpureus]
MQQKCICYDVQPTWVAGDVKVEFFERKFQRQLSLFYTWFNTIFVDGNQFALASKDKLDRPSSNLDTSFQVFLSCLTYSSMYLQCAS